MNVTVEMVYREDISKEHPDVLPEHWIKDFETALQLSLRGRYGYMGNLKVTATVDE